jgi:hypothetical protein
MGLLDILEGFLKIIIRWSGKSVSGLVVIVGLICILIYAILKEAIFLLLGFIFVLLGLAAAIHITDMIYNRRRGHW